MDILGEKVSCAHLSKGGVTCAKSKSQIRNGNDGCYLVIGLRQRFCYSCLETPKEVEDKRVEEAILNKDW